MGRLQGAICASDQWGGGNKLHSTEKAMTGGKRRPNLVPKHFPKNVLPIRGRAIDPTPNSVPLKIFSVRRRAKSEGQTQTQLGTANYFFRFQELQFSPASTLGRDGSGHLKRVTRNNTTIRGYSSGGEVGVYTIPVGCS